MFLNQNPKGQMLAEYYTKYSKFNEEQRTCLINSIAQFFEKKDVEMTLGCSFRLEKEVLERFRSEKLEYYRTKKRGKLYNKYCNLKKNFKAITPKTTNPQKAVGQNIYSRLNNDIETDAESCLRSLKFDNLTAEQFDSCWKACSKYRLLEIKDKANLADLFKKWPMYTTPTGFRLIDMDFNTGFERGNGLLDNWEPCIPKIVSFLKSNNNIKDKLIKGLLTNFNDSYSESKNTQEVEDYLSFLQQKEESIQPFIICIGESLAELREIYLYFDNIKYKFLNFLRAQCNMFWNFIESYFFKRTDGEKSYSKVHILSEFLD